MIDMIYIIVGIIVLYISLKLCKAGAEVDDILEKIYKEEMERGR